MAFGNATFSDAGGAVSDLFAAEGYKYKAQGNLLEAGSYDEAAKFADLNATFTEESTALKLHKAQRDIYQAIGGQEADIAGAGFENSGSALDLLRSSASEGALTKETLGLQGLITEQGYKTQADSYRTMAEAARLAAEADLTAATGSTITGIVKGVSAVASVASFFMGAPEIGLAVNEGNIGGTGLPGYGGLY